jgi:outer membrane protein OmpA-like peptidoglycan-associated protein
MVHLDSCFRGWESLVRVCPIIVLAALAACTQEPRYTYPPAYEAPMAPSGRHAPSEPAYSAPALPPGGIKPLRIGLLTAKNVGAYMDGEEQDLRIALRDSGAGVARPGDTIVLYLRDDLLFAGNSFTLSPRAEQILSAIAEVAAKYDSTLVAINGYTDTTGTSDSNMRLSQERADAVAHALSTLGIDARRILARGFGSTHLKVPTGANVGEPRNRRIEIVITPKMST